MKNAFWHIAHFVLACFLAACSAKNHIGPNDALSRAEYFKALSNNPEGFTNSESRSAIPKLARIVAMPKVAQINSDRLISISATDDIPLIDLLMEIGRVSGVDVAIDKNIQGGVFINIKNRPLYDVLDSISDIADLHYTESNGTIAFGYDNPFLSSYNVSFLNVVRTNSSSMNVSTSVLSGGGMSSGSSASLSSTTADSFWTDILTNIDQIVNSSMSVSMLKRMVNTPGQGSNLPNSGAGAGMQGMMGAGAGMQGMMGAGAGMQGGATGTGMQGGTGGAAGGSMTIGVNKSAGVITVFTSARGHKRIKEYIEKIKQKASAQAIIEIKIAEIILKKQFETGINLNYLKGSDSTKFTSNNVSNSIFSATGQTITKGSTLTGALSLLDTFGVTKVLASPRINAINNQQAMLTFADNEVYFDIHVTSSAPVVSGNGSTIVGSQVSVTSTPKTLPVGIILTLQPSIDMEKNSITLSVRPTLSRIKERIADPGFTFTKTKNGAGDIPHNLIPVTSTREMDSIITMKSGDIMIMGGFTERQKIIGQAGIPFLGRLPLFKWLFSSQTETEQATEIVILIKTTIIQEKETSVTDYDKYFYKTFFNDPRELEF